MGAVGDHAKWEGGVLVSRGGIGLGGGAVGHVRKHAVGQVGGMNEEIGSGVCAVGLVVTSEGPPWFGAPPVEAKQTAEEEEEGMDIQEEVGRNLEENASDGLRRWAEEDGLHQTKKEAGRVEETLGWTEMMG